MLIKPYLIVKKILISWNSIINFSNILDKVLTYLAPHLSIYSLFLIIFSKIL